VDPPSGGQDRDEAAGRRSWYGAIGEDNMVAFGYTLLTEQRDPRGLISDAVASEHAGFDFDVISDHYFPWLDTQGHSPNC
jgi:alkanesulfonate monooxygenase SsuD/methylene tetrahydromethanopterin reductase-like flavin-dependent oxidoreductase (luciferase family)